MSTVPNRTRIAANWKTTRQAIMERVGRATVAARTVGYRRRPSAPGITIVTVNWNSAAFLETWLRAVDAFTTLDHSVIVVDNNSSDGSRDLLHGRRDVMTLGLPLNVGHGPALDYAVRMAKTEYVVVLDVDAIPISEDWLAAVLEPLDSGAKIAGAHWQRDFIHPCFLALRRSDYVSCGLTFRRFGYQPTASRRRTPLFLDVGEAASQRLMVEYSKSALHRIPITAKRGPGWIGSVFGDVVYHNFYSTHGSADRRTDALRAWREAEQKYLGAQL